MIYAPNLTDPNAQDRNAQRKGFDPEKPTCFTCGRNVNPHTATTLYLTDDDYHNADVIEEVTPYPILIGPECVKWYRAQKDGQEA